MENYHESIDVLPTGVVIFVHRRHIISHHAFLKLTKQLPVQTTKWTRMLPCFLGSLQLPDGDCKVSWELPSESLWSFEATLARNQGPKSGVCGSVVPANMPRQRNCTCKRQFSKLLRQTQDGGASAGNALSHGARMLLVNLSLINKAERKDNNKYWTYLAYIHSRRDQVALKLLGL